MGSFSPLIEVPFCGFTLHSGWIGVMNRGAPAPLSGKVLSPEVSTWEPRVDCLELRGCSSSIGIVSDCLSGAPAVILRGFFLDNFILMCPNPGSPDSIVEVLSQTHKNPLYHSLHDYHFQYQF